MADDFVAMDVSSDKSTPLSEDDGNESTDDSEDPINTIVLESPGRSKNAYRLQLLEESNKKSDDEAQGDKAEQGIGKSEVESEKIIDQAREYQQELFERAKDENVIAVLDTGTGKTLIAAMLIRHILDQQVVDIAAGKPSKFVFFLAHSVPLVNQQRRFLAINLAASVLSLTGGGKEDLWRRPDWEKILHQNVIIVCTPAVLEQALFHAYVTIPEISLLIFDEAHHCKKHHPYSKIIRDYYLKSVGPKPRIFGMTASPVDSKKDIGETINNLETLLHSKVVTTSDTSLFGFAWKPLDVVWQHDYRGFVSATTLYSKVNYLGALISELRADFEFALNASAELGTWFTDRTLSYIIGRTPMEIDALMPKLEQGKTYRQLAEGNARTQAMNDVRAIYSIMEQHQFEPLRQTLPWMSSKVQVLFEQLQAIYRERPDTRTMIFVKQRWTAVLLWDAFRTLSIPNLHPGILVGGGQAGRENISAKKQEEVVANFHAGLTNILFATSVGEEGIDAPQCNVVVRFDPNTTTIQYIQSRGRARMKDSIYAHMVEKDNFDHRQVMNYIKDSAEYLKMFCLSLPSDRLLGAGTKLQQIIAKDNANPSFITALGVTCNFSNCLTILSRYAASVETAEVMRSETYEEEFENKPSNMFQYRVRIPANESSYVNGARGFPRQNKALAKRSAAFNCIMRLRNKKLLDDNLDSVFQKQKPANLNARLAVSAKRDSYDMKTKPDLWSRGLDTVPTRLYATGIEITASTPLRDSLASMVLLTREPLPRFPSFPIYLEDSIPSDVVVKHICCFDDIGLQEIELLTAYTLNAMFADVFNKVYRFEPQNMGYWLVPLSRNPIKGPKHLNQVIDMKALDRSVLPRSRWKIGDDPSLWCQKFLTDPLNGKYHYFSHSVVPGKGPFDPEPKAYLPNKGKKTNSPSIIYFTDSHWRKSEKDKFAERWDRNQPVLSAEVQTVRRNFLDRPTEKEQERALCWVAPEPLEIARLTSAEARTALTWPSILHRLEQYLIVLEAINKMGLSGIPADLALEAFTKDDYAADPENEALSGNCRGMGKNYERLEFIGDSLLKMTSTIAVFNRTTCDEKGMHCRRMEILCNRTLFNVATTTHGLHQYIRSAILVREYWYPEYLVLLKGRGADEKDPQPVKHAPRTHALSMKTIADVCEATIGAAVVSQKALPIETRFDLGIRAITTLVESPDHDLQAWSDFRSMYIPPSWQLDLGDPRANDLAFRVSSRIRYKFTCPRLLRSAFTHSSDTNAPVPGLQRMEFLGDACLDWVCVWWLFDSNPDRNPQWLTEHKMAMVSNKFLAALAITLDFHKFFTPPTVALVSDIRAYAEDAVPRYEAYLNGEAGSDWWTTIAKSPPKALADLVESTLGAILIDSNFNLQPLVDFFEAHILRFFANISLYDGFASHHPTSFIYKKLTDEFGCQDFKVMNTDVKEGCIETIVTAGVLIHDTVVARETGSSAKYAKVRVSKVALDVLDGMTREEFSEKFGCNCARGRAMEEAEREKRARA